MKSLQQMIGADRPLEETELDTVINASRGAGLLRGVKRRCLGVEVGGKEERGRSFLETKWEGEVRRRRELIPIFTCLLIFFFGICSTDVFRQTSYAIHPSNGG